MGKAVLTTDTDDRTTSGDPELLGERYQLLEELGRGGMAIVHRVLDTSTGRELALKRLLPRRVGTDRSSEMARTLFEAEYRTLCQLRHPRIVEAYDYRVEDSGAFYVMELLDGGDVSSLSPLGIRTAAAVARDVCSALSILHARRLVHRDISPRNIHCTASGEAKLIDFGAMLPMGESTSVVGTPAYCPPEVVGMRPLDARADLYSLGATLYYMLCGRHAYPARDFRQLQIAWSKAPVPPSQITTDVPQALDDLVLQLLQHDPKHRPESAGVVLERLNAIAGLPLEEQLVISQAYLNAPRLCGRSRQMADLLKTIALAVSGHGGAVMLQAESGQGRTRLLEALAPEAKLLGCTVAQTSPAHAQAQEYGALAALSEQLLNAHPKSARRLAGPHRDALARVIVGLDEDDKSAELNPEWTDVDRSKLQNALKAWILALSDQHPTLLVVDDVHRVDESSLVLLSLLAHASRNHSIVVLVSAHETALDEATGPLRFLHEVASQVTLGPLSPKQTTALLASIWDVAHLDMVAHQLHRLSAGNPRDLMLLARHLVERGVAQYRAGTWTLAPHVDPADLPDSLAHALAERVAGLSEEARMLGQAFALAPGDPWTRKQCLRLLEDESSHSRNTVVGLDELLAGGVVRQQEQQYTLDQPGWISPLLATLDRQATQELHLRVADRFEAEHSHFRLGQHLLRADRPSRALDVLVEHARRTKEETDRDVLIWTHFLNTLPQDAVETWQTALDLCERMNRPEADRFALRTRMTAVCNALGSPFARDLAMEVVRQCEHDAGLDPLARSRPLLPLDRTRDEGHEQASFDVTLDGAQATRRALAGCAEQPRPRVFLPTQALPRLSAAVSEVLGIAAGTFDCELLDSLPRLASLTTVSPFFVVMEELRRGLGDRLAGRYLQAHDTYTAMLTRLSQPDHADMPDAYYYGMRDGLLLGRALVNAAMGRDGVLPAADALEAGTSIPEGLCLRMLHSLWQGRGEQADHERERYLVAQVKKPVPQHYAASLLFTELCALSCCDDLARLRRIMRELEQWAAKVPGWLPVLRFAQCSQHRIGGDHKRALGYVRDCLTLVQPGRHQVWGMAAAAEVACLAELGCSEEAVSLGRRHRTVARDLGIDHPVLLIDMPLSLALSATGDTKAAQELASDVVERMRASHMGGVPLGLAHYHLARASLAATDWPGFQSAAARCGEVFEHSENRALSAKYRQLMRETDAYDRGRPADLSAEPPWGSTNEWTQLAQAFDACNGLEQRACLAAKELLRASQSEAVFIYFDRGEGLRRVATAGTHAPPPQMTRRVRAHLAMQLCEVGDVTITADDGDGSSAHDPLWVSPFRMRLYPLLLSHTGAQGLVVTAVAVIMLAPDVSFVPPVELAAQISRLGLVPPTTEA